MRLRSWGFLNAAALAVLAGCGGSNEATSEPENIVELSNQAAVETAAGVQPPDSSNATPADAEAATNNVAAPEQATEEQEATAAQANSSAQSSAAKEAPAAQPKAIAAVAPPAFAQCRTCHSTGRGEAHGVGPNLFGVVGAGAGSKAGYTYSEALKNSGIIWTRDRLDAFIAAPREVVPGTKMAVAGPQDSAARRGIIDYLASLR